MIPPAVGRGKKGEKRLAVRKKKEPDRI